MEYYELFEIGQIIHTSGDDALQLIFKDMACIPHQGEINNYGDGIYINLDVPDDDKLHVISVTLRGIVFHAISMIVNNKDKTYTILDSSDPVNISFYTDIIDAIFLNKGYTNIPHTCPRDLLPQKGDDALCTAWSKYMMYLACKGINPVDIPMVTKKEGLISFLLDVRDMLKGSDVLNNYRRWRRIQANYVINDESKLISSISHNVYRVQPNKKEFLDSIDLDFDTKTTVDRKEEAWKFFIDVIYALKFFNEGNSPVFNAIIDARTIQDMINVINDYYDPYSDIKYIIYYIFAAYFTSGQMRLLSPEEKDLAYQHYTRYMDTLHSEAKKLGIDRSKYNNEHTFLLDVRDKMIELDLSYRILFPDVR